MANSARSSKAGAGVAAVGLAAAVFVGVVGRGMGCDALVGRCGCCGGTTGSGCVFWMVGTPVGGVGTRVAGLGVGFHGLVLGVAGGRAVAGGGLPGRTVAIGPVGWVGCIGRGATGVGCVVFAAGFAFACAVARAASGATAWFGPLPDTGNGGIADDRFARGDGPSPLTSWSCADLIPRKISFDRRCSSDDIRPNFAG